MDQFSIEDLKEKVDSVYRLTIIAARRAGQVKRAESRPLVATHSKKPTVIALQEILDGKVTYRAGTGDEEDFVE